MSRRNQGPKLRWLDKRGCYYVTWTERGRSRERSTGAANREQAEDFFAQWLRARGHRGGPSDPSEVFVTDVLNDYASERGPKVVARERIGYAVAALADFWEGLTVADVTPQTCGRYAEYRLREEERPKSKAKWRRSPGTVRRELGVLRAAVNHAHRSGRITRVMAVELPERPEARERWLTRQEAARLIRGARTRQAALYMPLFILIGLYTGRRTEAILSLRWPQVDLDAGRIDFEVGGRRRTNKRRGKIPIPARLLPHLRRARMRGSDLGHVIHINGARIRKIKKGFAAACVRAGLIDVTPHTLRHTTATWLMRAGTDPWKAAGFLGMSMETLLGTYGHHHPDHMREAADNIGGRRPRNVRVIA